jgi:hypothetical protein
MEWKIGLFLLDRLEQTGYYTNIDQLTQYARFVGNGVSKARENDEPGGQLSRFGLCGS